MGKFRVAILFSAMALVVAGCAAPPHAPAPAPGSGKGAAYVPVVDTRGVNAQSLATDVAACRDLASNVRVIRLQGERDPLTEAVILGVGLVVPFGMVGMALISSMSAAMAEPGLPASEPADAGLQQTTLVNCMARKGYRNLDPAVTVTYVAPPPPPPIRPAGGRDTFVAECHAESNLCAQGSARALLVEKGPGFERYRVACDNGARIVLRCEFGNCTQESASLDVALGR